jgi:hypothetical protein
MRLKRIVLIVTVASLLAGVFAPVALAVDQQCTFRPCYGTDSRDTLYERGGRSVPDTIYGLRGGDRIRANLFGADRDLLYGGRGNDILNAQDRDGRDELYGGPGEDTCYVDEGDLYRGCEEVVLAIA